MDGGERVELVHILARRQDVLGALAVRPWRKPELTDELDVARSTVDRALRTLETEGLVKRVEDGFALTTCGELTVAAYGDFVEELAVVCGARDIVEALPSSEFADPVFLRDAEVIRASVSAPDRPVRAFVDMVSAATHARGFSPTASGAYVEVFERRVVDAGMTAELVFSDEALEELTTTHRESIQGAVETGRVDVHRIEALPPTGVVVLTREDDSQVVALGVHDRKGLSAVVRNDDQAAVEWAEQLVDDRFERADRIPL